ncbi:spore coat protein U domain-containing protein [Polaromonas sp.]|uniref:spore coat protein U domain-containing protein n=1 Tax=Polaromonas sp. TaxID=1869339 RepID=UPI00335FA60F
MKKLILVAALGLSSLLTAPVQAANDSATVNVTINLTSKCVFGVIAPVAFTYTSFQGTAATGTGGTFNMKCTNSMPYKIGFTNAPTPATTLAVLDATTNLNYTLGLSATTGTGSGIDQAYTVSGTMAAAQAGTCGTAGCTNGAGVNSTLYVVY